ncbi:uncharacterized protein LOC114760151 [Neltuma alba]|uniref:uncharacterized protein LOC114760151 n=1 Tax=Neltuma alba TaxID=207710 RepID=UPI0010A559DC|nr:uncharacterized protein LOC114760151 [Prosopis alba]
MSLSLTSAAVFPPLSDSGWLTAEEADLLQQSKKKIKGNDAEVRENGAGSSYSEMLKGRLEGSREQDEVPKLESLRSEIKVLKHKRGAINIPEFVLAERALQQIRKPFQLSLIVKLLGARMSNRIMEQRIQKMWAKKGSVSVIDLSNDFYVVQFTAIDDYEIVVLGGPWMISDSYLTVRQWKPNFDPLSEAIEEVLVWVRFPDLPLEYYEEDILEAMGNEIGRTMKVDLSMSTLARGGYARVGVMVNLKEPLLPVYIINNVERPVTYEGLHLLCFNCGRYGHLEKECPGGKGQDEGKGEGMEAEKEQKLYGS